MGDDETPGERLSRKGLALVVAAVVGCSVLAAIVAGLASVPGSGMGYGTQSGFDGFLNRFGYANAAVAFILTFCATGAVAAFTVRRRERANS